MKFQRKKIDSLKLENESILGLNSKLKRAFEEQQLHIHQREKVADQPMTVNGFWIFICFPIQRNW